MKSRLTLLVLLLTAVFSTWAKSEVKQPDTYAYTRGVEATKEGNYEDAMDWFNRELSDHPDNGYAYLYICLLRYENAEYGRSLSAVDKALKLLPKKDKPWRAVSFATRAEIFAAMGDTIKALDDLSQAIQNDPSNSKYYNTRAQLHYERKNYDLANADYQKMIDMDQGDVMGYMGIGRNANALMNWDEAISLFNHVTKLEPNYSSGYSFRAEAYIGQEKWNEATDDIVKALDIDGDDKAFSLMLELPKDASDLLKSKLKIQMAKQPANRYWPYCLAVLADANKNYEEGISYFEKANELDANSYFLERISRSYKKMGDLQKALDYVERALFMSPEDYDLVDLKADILSDMGRYEECLFERDRYVAHDPENPMAYCYRADDLIGAGRFKDAIEDFNTAVVLDSGLADFPVLRLRRGEAYRLLVNTEEARKDYEAVIELEKDSVFTSGSYTQFAYSGLGNKEKAIESMQYVLENDTTDITGNLYNAACVYARLGMTKEAVDYLKQAIEKGYDNFYHIATDYDLDNLRELPEYKELMIPETPAIDRMEIKTTDELKDTRTETVEIPFTKEDGVTKVKCSINGLPLHFVFDTGAADVTMSQVEANFMLKNDYIKPTDIVGSARYMDANGDITVGTVVNLRNVNFGGLELENVRASVVRNQKAPLLLGQSVLGRLGKIEIDNPGLKLVITHKIKDRDTGAQ